MDSHTTTGSRPRAGRREWIGLAVLALPTLLLALDFSVLYLALPNVGADLAAGANELLWIADTYGFMLAGFLVTMGTLGDRIGRRKLLIIGAAAFGVASVLAAYASGPEMLIVARGLLGIAGATLMPSTLALISNMFADPRQRALAFGVWVSCFMGGTTIGPVIGGAMLEFFWWGSVFLLAVPVMAVLLIAAPLLLPEYRSPAAGRLDMISVALSLAAILPVVYAIKESAKDGWHAVPVAALVIGLTAGVMFVQRQRNAENPMLDLSLFASRSFTVALTALMLNAVTLSGISLLVNQYLQTVEGLSPLRAGLLLAPASAAIVVTSLLAPVIARRVRPAYVIAVGLALTAVGCALLSRVETVDSLLLLVIGNIVLLLGAGAITALGTDLIVGAARPEKAGSAGAIKETADNLGIAMGVAILGSIATATYRSHVTTPDGLPAGAANTARESAANAVAVAQDLPAPVGTSLIESAREAFTAGLNIASAVGAAIIACLAVLTFVTLKHVESGNEVAARTAAAERTGDASVPAP
ncbi:MFS transporter [Nonomuraea sp. KM90]|uniref:MFS transporter n=1 Tax=Nonomuraea sp. KM90 TaxID=3457428 RepID=UPI003FCEBFA7